MAIDQTKEKTLEGLDRAAEINESGEAYRLTEYSPAYVDAVFTAWYSAGKVSSRRLCTALPDPAKFGLANSRPSEAILTRWIRTKFLDRAAILDEQVNKHIQEKLIAEKVEMLQAHAVVAEELQMMGLTFFKEHPEKINAMVALRLIVEGIRIQRESVGIPRTLEKLAEKSDEELMKQIEEAILNSPSHYLPIDSVEVDDAI